MSTSKDNTITYDERSKRCIDKVKLSESELTNIHKALIVVHKTCENIKSITYNADEESIKLHCGRSLGTISFGLNDDFTSEEVTINYLKILIYVHN
jgi:hypothetical protein